MSRYLIKPERDRDLYVMWSAVVDSPVMVGTRAQFLANRVTAADLDCADQTGTSHQGPFRTGAWDDAMLVVSEPLGGVRLLPRGHAVDYLLALFSGDRYASYAMTRRIRPNIQPPESTARRRMVRQHYRQCAVCNPAGNPPPLPVDGRQYARRRRARRHRT